MRQTPAHDQYNPTLLGYLPADARRVVEVGCSTGALARAYRAINPGCDYVGIEIDQDYAAAAADACARVLTLDIEQIDDAALTGLGPVDCWVFGDALEHLRDPWQLLARLRPTMAPGGSVVACIPNAQHWSVQVKLNSGLLRYEDAGLLDRTHLRFFTRITMLELFNSAGYRVVQGTPRVFDEPGRDQVLPLLRALAQSQGIDPDIAAQDAMALQYVVRAVPA